jgi:predicted Rossmann-fold nucleotide-binding protein
VIELMSWRRLALHAKPIVFFDQGGYWRPLFDLIAHTVEHRLTPAEFLDTWRVAQRVEDILPQVRAMAAEVVKPISLLT